MMSKHLAVVAVGLLLASSGSVAVHGRTQETVGIFTGSGDIGTPSTLGPGRRSTRQHEQYVVSGGGANMWAAADHFNTSGKKYPAT